MKTENPKKTRTALGQLLCLLLISLALSRPVFAQFNHPGALSNQADLDRMVTKVAAGAQPWKGSWDILVSNTNGFLDDAPLAQSTVYVDSSSGSNYIRLARDCAKAYQCALRWHGSGDTRFAAKAVEILNAWASTHTNWEGNTNVSLRRGLYGYQLACAGELMRGYSGWAPADFTVFRNYMVNLFYPGNVSFLTNHHGTCATHYWANWDLANIASVMAIGVLCDDQAIFDYGLDNVLNSASNGSIDNAVHWVHPDGMGQWQESGRDQGHALMGPQLLGVICEIAWNQGIDLYGYKRDKFLASTEYIAKYNLWYDDVPWSRYWNCEYEIHWGIASWGGRGNIRPGWDLVYNHYVNRLGMAAPYTAEMAAKARPEGGGFNNGTSSGGFDSLGFTTLTHSRDPIAAGAVPSKLVPYVKGRQITLSWRGSAYATSYNVKRSTSSGGPYTTIATVVSGDNYYIDAGLTQGITYHYVVSANNPGGESANSAAASATANGLLYGTVIGTNGSYGNKGMTKELVFDGSLRSFFNGPSVDGVWVGLDLGSGTSATITQVKYTPREGYAWRMVGGKFQGSTTADFTSGVVDLFTITEQPPYGVLTSKTVNNGTAFRYVRYIGANGTRGDAAEIQFLGNATGLGGAPATPDGVSVSVAGNEATISWNAVPGTERYYVKRATTSGGPYMIVGMPKGELTEFVDSGLDGGTTYYYTVSALNLEGESPTPNEQLIVGATAGSQQTGNPAANSFDGDPATRWANNGTVANAWIQYDLGAVHAISDVQLLLYNGTTRSYPIRIEIDGVEVFNGNTTTGTAYWTASFPPTSGRYVTITMTGNNSDGSGWFSIYEAVVLTQSIADGTYEIRARHSGKCLDVAGVSTADGGNIHQWGYVGNNNQKWSLTHLGNGQYRITSIHSGKALEVDGISTADGANIQQWGYVGQSNQKWTIEPVGSGYYRILAAHSGKAVDVSGISTSDGANVHQWSYVGQNNQQWQFIPR